MESFSFVDVIGKYGDLHKPSLTYEGGDWDKWKDTFKELAVNPNGEYVVGYGYVAVTVQVKRGRMCTKCEKREDD